MQIQNMIRLTLIGRLGKDAEVKTTQSGKKVINFSVAHTEKRGETEHTVWLDAAIWKNKDQSTKIADYLKKGSQVYLEGEPTARAYNEKAYLGINVSRIDLLERKAEAATVISSDDSGIDDDLPF